MTNSKKIKRNIGASRRLAPFGHVRMAQVYGLRHSDMSEA